MGQSISTNQSGSQNEIIKDVNLNIQKVTELVQGLNSNDFNKLKNYAEQYNNQLSNPQMQIPQDVINSMMVFHEKILKNLNIQSGEHLVELLSNPESSNMKQLIDVNTTELMKQVNSIGNENFKEPLDKIFGNIFTLKMRYKYFEYKYIEMNIFILLFVQKVYELMDSFTNNVLEYNKNRDESREKMMTDFLNLMVNIMSASDLQLDANGFNQINKMMENIKSDLSNKEKDLNDKLGKITEGVTNNLSLLIQNLTTGDIKTLTETDKTKLKSLLDQSTTSQGQGSTSNRFFGGFVREGSSLPKDFYNVSKK